MLLLARDVFRPKLTLRESIAAVSLTGLTVSRSASTTTAWSNSPSPRAATTAAVCSRPVAATTPASSSACACNKLAAHEWAVINQWVARGNHLGDFTPAHETHLRPTRTRNTLGHQLRSLGAPGDTTGGKLPQHGFWTQTILFFSTTTLLNNSFSLLQDNSAS